MGRFATLMKTTAVRLSALYLLLFAMIAGGLAVYMSSLSVSTLTAQTRQSLHEEVAGIAGAYQRGGLPVLMRTIERRIRQPGAFLYVLADPAGRILAGNVKGVEAVPPAVGSLVEDAFYYSRFGDGEGSHRHKAVAAVLNMPNGMKLLVGRDLGEAERFAAVIRQALVTAFAVMVLGALFIWFFIGQRALLRIDSITSASHALMSGDLSGRLPVSGAGDEFDRLSKNLNVMLERIEALNTGLRQVSDNVAHDLKTPLTRLRNRAEAALVRAATPRDYRAALDGVIAEADQMIRTFNAIVMISRLEAGNSPEHLQVMPLRRVVEDALEFYEPVAEEAGITLDTGALLDGDVRLNRELVAQSIFNLLDNALKYGRAEIRVSMEMHNDRICVVVSDHGAGIPADLRERVTERFFRLEESRTKPGAGIGLSMARAVMKLHEGALLLEENPPAGLRAVLAFPLARQ
ncbi:MAG: Histidine kinase [Candidatus Tokpelaia hoelldobleri]|uniref:histidine kinase n=1 Tax=Candidatus Tokpelaia hoelldobleri TaxID=1902579 RepID=A0A1U9JW10_9HYPH|nr:MAG: Histidine kinase [Candidatus Tokpelaia hoelldoblerii]